MIKVAKIECGINFRLRENKAVKPTPITCFVELKGNTRKRKVALHREMDKFRR